MTTNERLERTLSVWLHDDGAFRVPDHLDEVLAVTRQTRQRPAWSSLERWLPMDTTFRPRLLTVPPAARLIAVAILLLLVAAIAIFAVGSRQRLPEPFGLARNGTFLATRDGDIYTVDATTSTPTRLLGDPAFDFGAFYSRDGTKFVFLRSEERPPSTPDSVAVLTMYVANADGSAVRAITPPTDSLDWFDWSPDGTQIVYVAKKQVWVVDVAGGEPRRIKGAVPAHYATWLPPDGKEIVYRAETSSPAIFAIPADGSGERRPLTSNPAVNEFDFQALTVSPDGLRIGFTRWSDFGVPSIHALDVATGTEFAYPNVSHGQRHMVFSPDGSLVAFARLGQRNTLQIAVVAADGSGAERLIGPVMPANPDGGAVEATWTFTPDGSAIVVRFGNDDAGTIHLIPLDGSEGRILDRGGFQFIDVQRLAP
jgi:Tol biopolymer transport system component